MSRNYEMMYILRPDLTEDKVSATAKKYEEFLTERGATDLQIQIRGRRRMAYEIQRFQDGIYIQMNYKADGTQVKPLERDMRLSEEVIRYLTLKLKEGEAVESPSSQAPSEPADPSA